jgi:hypothetical protein
VPPAPVFDPDQPLGVLPAPGFAPDQLLEACLAQPAMSAAPEIRLVMQRPARSCFMRSLSIVTSFNKADHPLPFPYHNGYQESNQGNEIEFIEERP